MTALARVHRLVGRYGPIPAQPFHQPRAGEAPWLRTFQAESSAILAGHPEPVLIEPLAGGGRALDPETAWRIAAVETLERYATAVVPPELPIGPASAMPYAVDVHSLPRHSDQELADHPAELTRLDRETEVRWATGVDLSTWSPVQVPAAMVYQQLTPLPGDRFWKPLSTGVAAGSTRTDALFSAICEVIERDMIAVSWLQRLPLPRLDPGLLTAGPRRLVAWCERKYTQVHLFDATSEIGVPTVYCLLHSPYDRVAGLVVGASAGADLSTAAERALAEGITIPAAVHYAAERPEEADEMLLGAVEIGRPERWDGFDFLLHPARPAPPRTPPDPADPPLTGPDRLDNLVRRCTRAGHRVYAFDLTTPELREIGLHVVRAVIPSLQPMAFGLRGRYLGHRRLYELPELLGHPVHPEPRLNHRPQPFA